MRRLHWPLLQQQIEGTVSGDLLDLFKHNPQEDSRCRQYFTKSLRFGELNYNFKRCDIVNCCHTLLAGHSLRPLQRIYCSYQ
ncbi:unnamed protein product [Tenebrio molitor]|nr:unnamed protein product [Tenebrio molitor]